MKKIVKKHPLAIRWFHWINFPILAIMIWSGLLIYWANDIYKLGWGDKTVLKFFSLKLATKLTPKCHQKRLFFVICDDVSNDPSLLTH